MASGDVGNEESLTSQPTAAVRQPQPLTATIHNTPGSHDGQSEFTFDLRFSEEPKQELSYVTLRDVEFSVTGGEILNARRLAHGKNALDTQSFTMLLNLKVLTAA